MYVFVLIPNVFCLSLNVKTFLIKKTAQQRFDMRDGGW
jgi:hypothetical protein